MIKKLKRVFLWCMATLGLGLFALIVLLTTPSLMYAHHTSFGNIEVYHNQPIPAEIEHSIAETLDIVKDSEIYNADMRSSLCLNDGSKYPSLVEAVLGADVFTAFANKVVVLGTYREGGRFLQWDQDLSFSQFLAHGLMHNYQFSHHGFWGANPLGKHPQWKWEGYVDYQVIGKSYELMYLNQRLEEPVGDYDWLIFQNGESTIKMHLKYLTLVKYMIEEKGLDYNGVMESALSMEAVEEEFKRWVMPN